MTFERELQTILREDGPVEAQRSEWVRAALESTPTKQRQFPRPKRRAHRGEQQQ